MSKYANLPDIDTAPDVYETFDAPPTASRPGEFDDSDEELLNAGAVSLRRTTGTSGANDAIDESRLPSFDAAGKKFGALAAMTYTLYPTMTPRNDPVLASGSLPSNITVYPSSAVEHPRSRLRRLRYEIEELEQQLAQAPESTSGSGTEGQAEAEEATKTARMMEELKGLQVGLRNLDVKAGASKEKRDGWESQLKKLESNISRSATPAAPVDPSSAGGPSSTGVAGGSAGGKVTDLDQRLAALESVLGTQLAEADESRAQSTPILPTLTKLDHLLALLTQPRHLDAISRRIKLLLTDLDRAQNSSTSGNKRRSLPGGAAEGTSLGLLSPNLASGLPTSSTDPSGSTLTPAQTQKLEQAFQIVPRLQPLLPLLPHLLARLRSLSDLHESAANFEGTLHDVEQATGRLTAAQKDATAVMDRLEGSLKSNEEMIEGNFQALGKRVEDLRSRMEALNGLSS